MAKRKPLEERIAYYLRKCNEHTALRWRGKANRHARLMMYKAELNRRCQEYKNGGM